jgi:hypothetical protein
MLLSLLWLSLLLLLMLLSLLWLSLLLLLMLLSLLWLSLLLLLALLSLEPMLELGTALLELLLLSREGKLLLDSADDEEPHITFNVGHVSVRRAAYSSANRHTLAAPHLLGATVTPICAFCSLMPLPRVFAPTSFTEIISKTLLIIFIGVAFIFYL